MVLDAALAARCEQRHRGTCSSSSGSVSFLEALVIAISGLACILAGLGGLVHRHCVSCNEEAPSVPAGHEHR